MTNASSQAICGAGPTQVLIPLPGIGTLALAHDTYAAALAAGAALTTAQVANGLARAEAEPLVDAAQAATQLGLESARWLEDNARAGIIPHHKFGRFVRFRVSEVAAHCRVPGAGGAA